MRPARGDGSVARCRMPIRPYTRMEVALHTQPGFLRRCSPVLLALLALIQLFALTACGVLEVGVEPGPTASATKAAKADQVVATPSATTHETRQVAKMMTPTPTPAPSGPLRVAFAKEGDVWLWAAGGEPRPLTQTGDVGEASVRISDDGALVAFTRGRELWAIDADGTGGRRLVGEAGFGAMAPLDPGVSLYLYDWVPGTHTMAFNTRLDKPFVLDPIDDLHLVDGDTMEHTMLLAPGQGGHFYPSPDGSQIAIVRSGTIDLLDIDGGNRRPGVLTYTPSKAYAGVRYYAEAVWAADSSALGVTIAPPDPDARPVQYTTVWHVAVDGRPGRLVANISTVPEGRVHFSPDLAYVAYLQQPEGDSTSELANLMITEVTSDKTVLYAAGVWRFSGWAPGTQTFAFLSVAQPGSETIRMQVGWLDRSPLQVESHAGTMSLVVRWIDAARYLVLGKRMADEHWVLTLGGAGDSETVLAVIPELPGSDVPLYDFASRQTPVTLAPTSTPTPVPILTPLPRPSALHVAFVKDGDVWLWQDDPGPDTAVGKEAVRVTSGGNATDVRISGDGEVLAYVQDGELWAVEVDGSHERRLVSAADLSEMEPIQQTEFRIVLNRFEWVPGTHTVAFNTRLDMPIGLMLNDDLYRVDADSLGTSLLLPPGQGGEFTYSPDGRQVAVAKTGGISLYNADGQNRRDVLTYTPVATRSEFRYYARPVWEAYSQSLRVAIPPVDPFAQPPQPTSIWYLPTDGMSAALIGSLVIHSEPSFSPELKYVAYLEHPEGGVPGHAQGMLQVTNLETGETIGEYPQAGEVYGWAPDSGHFAFLAHPGLPQAQIARFGSLAVPAHDDAEVASIDVRWVDASHYVYLAGTSEGWSLLLGKVDGPAVVLMTVTGRSTPPYDFVN